MVQHGERWVGVGLVAGIACLGAAALGSGPVEEAAASPSSGLIGPVADCRVVVRGQGLYRLSVGKAGPVPEVTFEGARSPRFDQPKWEQGRPGSCNYPLGTIHPTQWSPNATPLLFHVSNEVLAELLVNYSRYSAARPQFAFPYTRMRELSVAITQGALVRGIREGVAAVAAELISRYANPTSFLTDAGAKWVAEQGIKLMLESYVAGRDPGQIIDGQLTRMVQYLQGNANLLAGSIGGPALQQALKPELEQMAADLTTALVELQPEPQWVRIYATNDAEDCTQELYVDWSMKGGIYTVLFTIKCGKQQNDFLRSVRLTPETVEPGAAGKVTAQALSQLGVPLPLTSATITGVAPVMAPGSAEPVAVIAGNLATFNFTAGDPRADKDYPNSVNVTANPAGVTLSGVGRGGKVTVLNVGPKLESVAPASAEAAPGERLELNGAVLTVLDRNADKFNPGEVRTGTIKLTHPAKLITRPLFDDADNPRRVSHDPTTGRYKFSFSRSGRVEKPHEHGSWPLTIEMADDNGLTTTTTLDLTVTDVAPTVMGATTDPGFVHRGQKKQIMVSFRVQDDNGVADIVAARVDATAAGGGIYMTGNGLTETGRGEDWIEYRLDQPFPQTDAVGEHAIGVSVTDEMNSGIGTTSLHVGNLAPIWGGSGFLFGADSIPDPERPDRILLVRAKGLCPNDQFRVGVIASDPENDSLVVKAKIVQTGAIMTLRHGSDKVWVGDMNAPGEPGTYTVELIISEKPADKEARHRHTITVIACDDKKDDDHAALPGNDAAITMGNPVVPADIAGSPRDMLSQLLFGSFAGVILQPTVFDGDTPANPGPAASAVLDSLHALLGKLDVAPSVGSRPPVESYLIATGGSTGPVVQFVGVNRSGVPVQLPSGGAVFEPVRISAATQARVSGLLQKLIALNGAPKVLNAYCLELLRKPPAAGTILRLAGADVQQRFGDYQKVLGAADKLEQLGRFTPDGDITGYGDAIRQWAIWAREEKLDFKRFESEFLRTTRQNYLAAGEEWTDRVEKAVRGLAPNRWKDVQQVLAESGLEPK